MLPSSPCVKQSDPSQELLIFALIVSGSKNLRINTSHSAKWHVTCIAKWYSITFFYNNNQTKYDAQCWKLPLSPILWDYPFTGSDGAMKPTFPSLNETSVIIEERDREMKISVQQQWRIHFCFQNGRLRSPPPPLDRGFNGSRSPWRIVVIDQRKGGGEGVGYRGEEGGGGVG